jgi:hypothetical protein
LCDASLEASPADVVSVQMLLFALTGSQGKTFSFEMLTGGGSEELGVG